MEKPVDIKALNQVLRDELSAVETYHQALDKNRQQYGQDARFMQLDQMCRDHEQTAQQLRSMIRSMGGTESQDSGAWGTWAKTVMGTAKLLGDKAALKALKEGEESGIKDYEDVLQNRTAPPDVQSLLSAMISKSQEHVRALDRLIETA